MPPPRILPLSTTVVNRIAAGEIIQRPASFIKEAIENSLDAGSTSIAITIKPNMIQIVDNGHGIHPDDLQMVCRRHSTSKLRSFEELQQVATYGFRGEALASATYVATVSITTQTLEMPCALRASYRDGEMMGKATRVAGLPGTVVTVENLFANDAMRLNALRSPAEEYARVLDVAEKYALHHSGQVSFSCGKAGAAAPDVHTKLGATLRDNVTLMCGSDLTRELVDISLALPEASVSGAVTNANYSRKRGDLILFINDRLVECAAIKRAIDAVYAELLPKNGHYWAYLSLKMPRDHVDVNTHPAKAHVAFLHEQELCAGLQTGLRALLEGASRSRTFEVATQTQQPTLGIGKDGGWQLGVSTPEDEAATGKDKEPARRPEKKVRTDASQQAGAMDKFVRRRRGCGHDHAEEEGVIASEASSPAPPDEDFPVANLDAAGLIIPTSDALELASIHAMKRMLVVNQSQGATDLLRNCVFVGCVHGGLSLVQFGQGLFAVDHAVVCKELMFQRCLALFGRFLPIEIQPKLRCSDLATPQACAVLREKEDLLYEYFGIDLRGGELKALPRLVSGLAVNKGVIPQLLTRLASGPWDVEDTSLRAACEALAEAMAVLPPHVPVQSPGQGEERDCMRFALQHCIFPQLRQRFHAPKEWAEAGKRVIVQLASTADLYRVFERC